ncbi:hypothetical protein MMC14_008870 [Varicellaria rhodocarpa]|nr:hypothetical protein [Varicellaria rhodocarpa]
MSLYLLSIGSIALLSLFLYRFIFFPAFLSPLSKIPNAHWTSSIFPIWIWWKRHAAVESLSIYSAHQKVGPIVRLGPNELSVNSLDGLRQIYTAGLDKHSWYRDEFMNYGIPNLMSTLPHKPHSIQRRMISHIYSKSYLQNSSDLCVLSNVVVCKRLLPLLYAAAVNDSPVDVFKLAPAVGMDFTSGYLFGISNSTNFINDVSARRYYSKLRRSKLRRSSGTERASKEIEFICMSMCEAADAFIQTLSNKKNSPAVDLSQSAIQTTHPVVYSQLSCQIAVSQAHHHPSKSRISIVASEMLDHLVAGYDTSGVAITYLIYQMSLHPAMQDDLRKELHTLSPPLKYPLPQQYAYSDLPLPNTIDALPFLNAIIHETLRLHSPNPSPLPRMTPARSITLEGYPNIPTGVRVSTSAYSMHRNERAYPEPEAWKPERWLRDDKENGVEASDERRRWFWAFGSGGRMCVGSNFALYQLRLVAAAIYTSFTTTVVDDTGIEQMDSFVADPKGEKLVVRFHRVGG